MFDGVTNRVDIPIRDQIGEQHFMSCLDRKYSFPVDIYQVDENGERRYVETVNP